MPISDKANAAAVTQFLTFHVGNEEYGIDILRVQEIKGYMPITPLPNASPQIKGVMNLRGIIVPVVGLRETFGMAPIQYDKFSVIIVAAVGQRVVGLLVDAVSEVVDLAATDIDMAPELGAGVDTSIVRGMGRAADQLIILLDVERVVSGVERHAEPSSANAYEAEHRGAPEMQPA